MQSSRRGAGVLFLACAWACSSTSEQDLEQSEESGRDADDADEESGTGNDGATDDPEGDGDSQGGDGNGDGAGAGDGDGDGQHGGTTDDRDGGADAGGASSAGSLPCDEAFEHEGLSGCLSTIDDTQVKFFPLDEGRKVRNLAVYLHQDTAWEWYSNDAFPVIVEWARARDIMVVAPLSTVVEDGEPQYGAAGTVETVNQLGTLLEKIRDTYGASRERTYYWGGSGGSWFLSFWFIPQMGKRLPGIFVPSCGGDASNPFDPWAWDPDQDSDARSKIAIYYNYGSEDFLAPSIEAGIADYRAQGFAVDSLVHAGQEHCVHPIDAPTLDFWSRHL